jgi:hypothetical protein
LRYEQAKASPVRKAVDVNMRTLAVKAIEWLGKLYVSRWPRFQRMLLPKGFS